MSSKLSSHHRRGLLCLWAALFCCAQATAQEGVEIKPSHPVAGIAFSPDGKRLALAGQQPDGPSGVVTLWDVARGKPAFVLTTKQALSSVAFSPDGTKLAAGLALDKAGAGPARVAVIWEVASGKVVATLDSDRNNTRGGAVHLAFAPDGKRLATNDLGSVVRLWDPATGKEKRTIDIEMGNTLTTLAWSPDGRRLAVGGSDHYLRVYDPSSGKMLAKFKHDHSCREASFSPDGKTLAVAASGFADPISLWDVDLGKRRATIEFWRVTSNLTSNLSFSPDSKLLATGHEVRKGQYEVMVWDTATCKKRAAFLGHAGKVHLVAFSPDGNTLATVDQKNTVRLWALRK
jgi:WD40 repeat protein